MCVSLYRERRALTKGSGTLITFCVYSNVPPETATLGKGSGTLLAFVRSFTRVRLNVSLQIPTESKGYGTQLTIVGFLTCVDSNVAICITSTGKRVVALLASVRLLTDVDFHVGGHVGGVDLLWSYTPALGLLFCKSQLSSEAALALFPLASCTLSCQMYECTRSKAPR